MNASAGSPHRRRALTEPPRTVWLPAALAAAFLRSDRGARVPRSLGFARERARGPEVTQAIRLSLLCSGLATALSLILGLPLAWLFARSEFPGRAVLRAVVTLRRSSPVVGGVALLLAFGRRGWLGSLLDQWFGVTIPFTTSAAVLAEAYIAMPFLIFAAESGFRESDARYEEAAATLGAGPWRRFFRVTLRSRPRHRRGCGALLGSGAGRVRRHDHVRRELPRPNANDAARRIVDLGEPPRRGRGAELRDARDRARHFVGVPTSLASAGLILEARLRVQAPGFELDAELRAEAGAVSRSSAPTAPARPPRCARWRGSCRSPADSCAGTA